MITFIRRVRMLNGHFGEALDLLRERLDYLYNTHGVKIELKVRFGGPVGEVALMSHHTDAGELELFRRKVMADVGSYHLLEDLAHVTIPGETHDEIWLDQ